MAMIFKNDLGMYKIKRIGHDRSNTINFNVMQKHVFEPVETLAEKDIKNNVYGLEYLCGLLGDLFKVLGAYSDAVYSVKGSKAKLLCEKINGCAKTKDLERDVGEQNLMFTIPDDVKVTKSGEDWVLSIVEVE